MPGTIWALWRESIGKAGSDGLRLRIRPADAVAASLPWEAIYDLDRSEFPALNIDTPVVRYLEGPIPQRREPLPASLSVLLTGADSDPKRPLDVVAELDRVEAALRPLTAAGKTTVNRIDALRAGKLQTPLMQKKPLISSTLPDTGNGIRIDRRVHCYWLVTTTIRIGWKRSFWRLFCGVAACGW